MSLDSNSGTVDKEHRFNDKSRHQCAPTLISHLATSVESCYRCACCCDNWSEIYSSVCVCVCVCACSCVVVGGGGGL